MRHAFLLALAVAGANAVAASEPHSLDVVNAANIVSLAVSTGGSWQSLDLAPRDDTRTVHVDLPDAGTCLRDFRVQFADASALILGDVDVCSEHVLDPAFYRPRMHLHRSARMQR